MVTEDVVPDGWRTNLYVCAQRDFHLYASKSDQGEYGLSRCRRNDDRRFSGIISGWMDSGSNCMGLVIKKQDDKRADDQKIQNPRKEGR